ncbi:MAG: hypothetical protein E7385_05250 [Ruminococcaceae bacterium]|nr:hypothetical protein [Oscillospiraceae bacterium]
MRSGFFDKKHILLVILLCCVILFSSCSLEKTPSEVSPSIRPTSTPTINNNDPAAPDMGDFKAIWISQYDLTKTYTNPQTGLQADQSVFTENIKKILKNVKSLGFNTIILQVRPNADSMYPSEYYPMSEYVVGKYGNVADYDPVEIIVREAHEVELDIHAWINPMRAMSTTKISKIDNQYKIKQWYENELQNGTYIVPHSNVYYLNPAYEEVRQLIIDGATEVLTKYQFDGLHMDDYFYPTTDENFDIKAYQEYKAHGGKLGLMDFRREALNKLVAGLYAATKAVNPDLIFGISPAGIITNVYNLHCADIYTWCSTYGYIDYICPQVYFGLEHETYDFVSVCNTFRDIIRTRSVNLVIGMTFGKAYSKIDNLAGSGQYEWQQNNDILERCLGYTKDLTHCTGIAVFCYQYFYDPVSGEPVSNTQDEVNNFIPVLKEICW